MGVYWGFCGTLILSCCRYNTIHCMANLLAGLAPYHEEMAIKVIDNVLEDVRNGMEINHPR